MKNITFTLGLLFLTILGYSQNFSYDIKFHRLEFEVDPAVNFIDGKITTYYTPLASDFNEISFQLVSVLTVDSVVAGSSQLSFTHQNNIVNIQLGQTIGVGDLDSISVYYHGSPQSSGFGSFITDYHDGQPIMWTLSEPYGAMSWWPCKQILNDKADSIEMIVTAPIGNKVAGNGMLIDVDTIDSQVKYFWKHNYPITAYLVAFAVTNYAEYYDYVEVNNTLTVPILNYVYPENLSYAQSNSPNLIDVFQFFCDTFMIYPFDKEKYGHAQFGWGGGMEHQTMTFIVNFEHSLMAHELAHQWFGDYITCGSWEDIWLNEGFAVYLEGMTAEQELAPYEWKNWKKQKIEYITSKPDGSVFCDDTTSVSRIFNGRLTYAKGGMILNLLRWVIGDEAFFNGLRSYLHDPNLAYGHAKVDDLKQHLEQASDKDLTNFFNDWYYGEGYPIYNIYWSQDNENKIHISIEQSQSDNSVDFFELPLPIQLTGTQKDTLIILDNTEQNQEFVVDLDFEVTEIAFDPDAQIITANPIVTEFTDISIGDDIILSPNPVKAELKINFPVNLDIENISIYDVTGTKIFVENYNKQLQNVKLNLDMLKSGIYFIKIKTINGTIQKKFIKR